MFNRQLLNAGRLIGNQTLTQMRQTIYRPQLMAFMSTEIRKAIGDAVSSAPVVLFMKGTPEFPQCGFSKATIGILGQQGVDPLKFAAYNVLEDPELREAIKEFTEWPTIPQLFVNNEFVGGCDVIKSMAKSGELTELLEEAQVLVPEDYDAEEKS
ncbi:similar to Saccharomyces cerevisiae YPL059W GRX5 Hydroperoxide and superoxide-radical responsive glutathione-dependent oxidoreductase [Maudiozyma barnettii]|uniref:Monothiol glutaredoxin-5, mitochondrial n=1 Tax=Maudiozyma barnettii TaxID=61262 RepID=A0A8H2VHL3_9SACH|nr:monothiol glutaredoxin GRX5 [Kazachstania barnettii]CAB4255821.1 similar to Saccharomyces cerevisiae YPL059W GRX5 Hydroperoxide and superoxide-radical responsive glutathione-dependent oxidoreductase [Kazachstania barnettii]CAD1784382.1 similar to Saccharomyces cerevisiae YPL059W GRX5 Hydroperoxide and superoxide-radical responsive glutathione-dependent oxidoreductase [Kazachstania barnettii]